MIGLEDEEKLNACQDKIVAYMSTLEKEFDIRTIVLCLTKVAAFNTKLFIEAEHPLGQLLAMAWEQQVGSIEDIVPEPDEETEERIKIMDELLPKEEDKSE